MSTSFPTTLDALNNPSATDSLNTVGVVHHSQHSDANDAIEALEAKVGTDGSGVSTSLDYKVAQKPSLSSNTPASSAVGDSGTAGTGTAAARDDHRHAREAFVSPAIVLGTVAGAGVATTLLRSDATIVAFDATAPVTQAFSDVAAAGSAAVAARRDHVHGMPASPSVSFATPAIVLGTAAAAGAAGTVIRSDATVAAFDATVPTTSALADAAAAGSVAFAARRDHVHGRESFATPGIVLGTAAAAGAATTPIRSDSTIVAFDATVPVTQAFSDAAATGSAAVAARRDHKHGMPAATTVHTHDGAGTTSTLLGGVAEAGTGLPVASGLSAMALGDFASSTGIHSIVIGGGGEAQGTGHTSAAKATGDRNVVIGPNASSVVGEAVVIGRSAAATVGDQGVAIGRDAAVKADGVAVGVGSVASATSVTAVGGSASGTVQFGAAFGNSALASGDSSLALGAAAAASGAQSVALGGSRFTSGHAVASGGGAVAAGANTANAAGPTASNTSAIAVGSGDGTVVGAVASAAHSQAYGGGASAAHATAVALGKSAATTKANQLVLGTATEVVTLPGGLEHRVNPQVNTNYTLTATDYYVEFSTGNTARVATLPPATAANVGLTYWIFKTDAGTGTVTVTADTSGTPDLINGAATQVIAATQYHRIGIYVAAVDVWRIISGPGLP